MNFIKIGDTCVPVDEILYFKDQQERKTKKEQTFIRFKDGNMVCIDGYHSDEMIQKIGDLNTAYQD